MELVYLWVEEYKNIKKQGFNFSPRFKCEFFPEYEKDENSKEKLKDNCKLEIIDKEKTGEYYPKNFFGDNINITSIVGENGSGKSTINEFLVNNLEKDFKEHINKNHIFLIRYNNEEYIISTINVNLYPKEYAFHEITTLIHNQYQTDNSKLKKLLSKFSVNLYNYQMSNIYDKNTLNPSKNIYPNKKSSINNIEQKDLILLVESLLNDTNNCYYSNYFNPNEVIIETNSQYNPRVTNKVDRKYFERIAKLSEELDNASITEKLLFIIYTFIAKLLFELNSKNNLEPLRSINDLKEFKEVIEKALIKYIENFKNSNGNIISVPMNYKDIVYMIGELFDYSEKIKKDKLILNSLLGDNLMYDLYQGLRISINKNKLSRINDYFYIFKELPSCFNINFKDQDKNIGYNSLSSGEKSLLRLKYYITTIVNNNKNIDNFIILLDEPDIDLHPQWQKKTINYLIDTFGKQNKYLHIIFTTHSPFILSDLPKENVIFLKNGKQVDVDIDTFGANIHTLLSHGFFMENGLMGEFAKEKINKAIEYLNKISPSKEEIDYCENIISIIGEPILKRQLQKMLDSKRLKKVDKIDDIEKQIAELSQELEKLKNGQN